MTLPYKGDKGVKLVQKLKRTAKKFLPPNIKPVFAFKSKKLASHFKIKDNTNTKHKHDLVYKIKCPQEHCLHSYIGETARRLEERILEQNGKDKISSVFKHSLETGHDTITRKYFLTRLNHR